MGRLLLNKPEIQEEPIISLADQIRVLLDILRAPHPFPEEIRLKTLEKLNKCIEALPYGQE